MAENPIRVAAAATSGLVTGVLLEALVKRYGYTLDAGENLGDISFDVGEPPLLVASVDTGFSYFLDITDTTTVDDGLTCLVTQNGLRYHLQESAALKVAAVEGFAAAPTGSETNDTAYIVSASPTGAFTGHADDVAILTRRGWVFATPEIGTALLNKTTGTNYQFNAAGDWGAMATDIAASGVTPSQQLFPMGLSVEAQQNAPPGSPTADDGLYYLVGTSPSGTWSGHANDIATYDATSTWVFLDAYDGALIFNKASSAQLIWSATAGIWAPPTPIASICQGRLTTVSATPITSTDQTAKATVYFTPFKGNGLALYVNGAWALRTLSEISLSLSGYTTGKPYDIFVYDSSGTPTLESLVWTNDTTRATALTLQDGVLVKSGAATRRYVGTIYTTATGQTEDSAAKRMVWNYYNRAPRPMRVKDATGAWTYSSPTLHQANANTANQLEFVIGVAEDEVSAHLLATVLPGVSGNVIATIGLDSTTAAASNVIATQSSVGPAMLSARLSDIIAAGRHRFVWLEANNGGSVTITIYGGVQSGMTGTVLA